MYVSRYVSRLLSSRRPVYRVYRVIYLLCQHISGTLGRFEKLVPGPAVCNRSSTLAFRGHGNLLRTFFPLGFDNNTRVVPSKASGCVGASRSGKTCDIFIM